MVNSRFPYSVHLRALRRARVILELLPSYLVNWWRHSCQADAFPFSSTTHPPHHRVPDHQSYPKPCYDCLRSIGVAPPPMRLTRSQITSIMLVRRRLPEPRRPRTGMGHITYPTFVPPSPAYRGIVVSTGDQRTSTSTSYLHLFWPSDHPRPALPLSTPHGPSAHATSASVRRRSPTGFGR